MLKIPKMLHILVIQRVEPELDDGRFPIKEIVGETIDVTTDIFKEGHDKIKAALRFMTQGQWQEA